MTKDKLTKSEQSIFLQWMDNTNGLIHKLVDDINDVHKIKKDMISLKSRLEMLSSQLDLTINEYRSINEELRELHKISNTHLNNKEDRAELLKLIDDVEKRISKNLDVLTVDYKASCIAETKFREKMWLHIGKYAAVTTLILTVILQVLIFLVRHFWDFFASGSGNNNFPLP